MTQNSFLFGKVIDVQVPTHVSLFSENEKCPPRLGCTCWRSGEGKKQDLIDAKLTTPVPPPPHHIFWSNKEATCILKLQPSHMCSLPESNGAKGGEGFEFFYSEALFRRKGKQVSAIFRESSSLVKRSRCISEGKKSKVSLNKCFWYDEHLAMQASLTLKVLFFVAHPRFPFWIVALLLHSFFC